ncbi:cytochrome P450 [Camillea tinctor]|nr:cytochrome P450 [Camillea tinctor]
MAFLDSLKVIAAYAAFPFIAYAIVVFSYRLLLLPLRSYPGPLGAKLSDAYNGYFSMQKCLHLVTQRDHRKYGSVIRNGPNKLLFNSAKALHDIYDNDNIVKSHVYLSTVQSPGVYSLFTVIDKPSHSVKRKIVGQALNDRSMRIFEPTMTEQIDLFIKYLSLCSKDAKPVNITDRVAYLACDIIALLSLGFRLRLQTDPSYRWMIQGMFLANHLANVRMQYFRLQQLRRLLEKMIITRSSEDKHVRYDLYSIASEANSEGEAIRASEIWSEAMVFFPAGAFSTAAGTCALFFYLSRNPKCYQRLVDEIRSTFSNNSEIQAGPKLASCKYLRACIDEALRIAPPVPGTLWREVAAESNGQPLVVDGHVIPPGTQVGVNMYTLHHNEEYFPDPYAFKPERWLASETQETHRKVMSEAFSPFSIGYRGCAGKAMAYLETSLIIAKTLWYFNFESAPGKLGEVGGGIPRRRDGRARPDEYQLYDVIAGQHDGPYLVFKPRGDACQGLDADGLTF